MRVSEISSSLYPSDYYRRKVSELGKVLREHNPHWLHAADVHEGTIESKHWALQLPSRARGFSDDSL